LHQVSQRVEILDEPLKVRIVERSVVVHGYLRVSPKGG
jgi:hypothetical protein